ncbi:MAG: nucleotide exchange factor GrpE [Nanoarchaeota archaeon]
MTNQKGTAEQQEKEHSLEQPEQPAPPDPLQEMTELLKRTQANFENYRKQTEKRIKEMQAFAARGMLLQLLPIIDNFELALKNTHSPEEFMKGMELIYSQFITLLADQDVQPMMTEQQDYNPHLHEALMKVESELPENRIIEEFQKGYLLAGKVLRHAKVKVSAGRKKTIK